jgi:hypothetical protein
MEDARGYFSNKRKNASSPSSSAPSLHQRNQHLAWSAVPCTTRKKVSEAATVIRSDCAESSREAAHKEASEDTGTRKENQNRVRFGSSRHSQTYTVTHLNGKHAYIPNKKTINQRVSTGLCTQPHRLTASEDETSTSTRNQRHHFAALSPRRPPPRAFSVTKAPAMMRMRSHTWGNALSNTHRS